MTLPVDTLVCDTARIAAWQQDAAFDYNRELIEPQQTIWEWLFQVIMGFLSEAFHDAMQYELSWIVFAIIAVVLLVVGGWLLYKYRPGLFGRGKNDRLDYEVEEDTIYGIDFDTEIAKALAASNYRQAVRYLYLKTLRRLSDAGRINWQPSKTPSQYVYEVQRDEFRQLTQHFLRVRYGNFEATRELYDEMLRLSKEGGGE
jgi:hypothetical protein